MWENAASSPYSFSNPKRINLEDVDKYTLADYGLTIDALKLNHFGVDVTNPTTGEHLPDAFYEMVIETAVGAVEKVLDIALIPRIERELQDYYRNNAESYSYIHTHKKPIIQVEKFRLDYNGNATYNYPSKWWRVYHLHGHIEILPAAMFGGGNNGLLLQQMYGGFPQIAGVPGMSVTQNEFAPQVFYIEYVAGLLPPERRGVTQPWEMPPDLYQLIMKVALKEILQIWGRLVLGAGIAAISIDIDGVSQRIETTQSAMYGAASADIAQLNEDIGNLVSQLRSYFGLNLGII